MNWLEFRVFVLDLRHFIILLYFLHFICSFFFFFKGAIFLLYFIFFTIPLSVQITNESSDQEKKIILIAIILQFLNQMLTN